MCKNYFIGDLHLGHKDSLLRWRTDFKTIEEHNATVIDGVMSVAKKRNTLFLLGDCFLSMQAADIYLPIIRNGFGKLVFIPGNHDTDNTKRQAVFRKVIEVMDEVHALKKYKEFWLSHAPIHPEELRGRSNIHGHVHSNSLEDTRYINTSCEAINYIPIELEEIRCRAQY